MQAGNSTASTTAGPSASADDGIFPRNLMITCAHVNAHSCLAVCLVVACTLALTVLGDASRAEAAPREGDTARLAALHRLTTTQFAVIERYAVAALPMDEARTNTLPQSKVDATTRAMLRACRKFSRRDPLLRALRTSCMSDVELTQAFSAYNACSNAGCLPDVLRAMRAELRQAISGGRIAARAINATNLARGCRQAILDPPKLFVFYKRLDAAFAKVQRVMATGSPAGFATAQTALARAERARNELRGEPTIKRSLQLMRSTCR